MIGRRRFPAGALALLGLLALPGRAPGLDMTLGFKLGAGWSGYFGPDFNDYLDTHGENRGFYLSTSAGVFFGLILWDFLVIQPEVLFSMSGDAHAAGGGAFQSGAPGTIERVLTVRSIEVPLLLRLQWGPLGLFAGPALLFPLGGESRQEASEPALDAELETQGLARTDLERGELRSFVPAGVAGAGISLALGAAILTLEGRYTRTFQPIHEAAVRDGIIPSGHDFQIHGVQMLINVGYRF